MARIPLKILLALMIVMFMGALWMINSQAVDPALGCQQLGIDPNLNYEQDYTGGVAALRAYPSPDRSYVAVQWRGSYGHHWFYIYDCLIYRQYLMGTTNGYEGGRIVFTGWISDTEFSYDNNDRHETAQVVDHSAKPIYDQVILPPPELIQVIGDSPDGQWRLIYSSGIDRLYINILRQSLTDESVIENVTRSIGMNTFIEWSPDGSAFLFSSYRDGMYELYLLDWETFALERLTYSLAVDDRNLFRWDRDGHSGIIDGQVSG